MHPAVHSAIAALVAENKTPTVALTKSKLSEPVPMPLVIAGLTAYKNDPNCINTQPAAAPKAKATEQSQLDRIEQKLDRIEQKLDRLLALLEKDN
ncbi:hypothetical protein AAEU28_04225 [Pseudoalteromonas sp. SS15]|uniref:hypothetical protein n=1 Tax=Pseudoalteromonas sp. SS15 TaxID=3139393 RepID=UPI003BA9CB85